MSLTSQDRLPDIADAARRSARSAVGEDWQRVVVHAEALGNDVEIGLTVIRTDGSTTKKVRAESGLGASVHDLRHAMYDPAKGAWYVAEFIIDRGSDVAANYDYDTCPFGGLINDDDPDSEADADPDDLRRDHEMYPRPTDRLPAWHPAR